MSLTPDASQRKCELCGGEMKPLGRLPRRTHQQRPKMVFRCSDCSNVAQE